MQLLDQPLERVLGNLPEQHNLRAIGLDPSRGWIISRHSKVSPRKLPPLEERQSCFAFGERELFALALALAGAALLALFATLLFALALAATATLLLLTFAFALILVCHCSILFPFIPLLGNASQATEQVFGFRCSASAPRAGDKP